MNQELPPIIDEILLAFDSKGHERYAKEDVTQLEHALQTAALAQAQHASPTLVCAALLHDLGHILGGAQMPEKITEDLHDQHEEKAYHFLLHHFGDEVAEPVKLHVPAKRYLCTTAPDYEQHLSPTSLKSYYDQGGRMTPQELKNFESNPYYRDALQLRRWDDEAKVAKKTVPRLVAYIPLLKACLSDLSPSH